MFGRSEPATEQPMWLRLSLLGGIIFFCLILAASISAPALPATDSPIDQYAATYARDHAGHITSTFFSGVSVIAFVFFLAGLYTIIRSQSSNEDVLPLLTLLGGIASITMILIAQSVYAATAIAAMTSGVEPGFVHGLDSLVPVITLYSGFPRAVFLLAAAAAIAKTNVAPRWLAIGGVLAAIVGIVGTGAVFDLNGPLVPVGFLSMVLFALWTLLAGISLLFRSRPATGDRIGRSRLT